MGFEVKLGEGDVDGRAATRALRECKYSGGTSADVAAGDEEHLRDVVARMDRLLVA